MRGTVRARPGSSCHRPSPGPQVPARRGRGARVMAEPLPAAPRSGAATSQSPEQELPAGGQGAQRAGCSMRTSPGHGEVPGHQGTPHPRGKEGAQGRVEAELKGPYPWGPPGHPAPSPASPSPALARPRLLPGRRCPPRLCFPAPPAQPGRAAGWSLMILGAAWEQGTVGTQGTGA